MVCIIGLNSFIQVFYLFFWIYILAFCTDFKTYNIYLNQNSLINFFFIANKSLIQKNKALASSLRCWYSLKWQVYTDIETLVIVECYSKTNFPLSRVNIQSLSWPSPVIDRVLPKLPGVTPLNHPVYNWCRWGSTGNLGIYSYVYRVSI